LYKKAIQDAKQWTKRNNEGREGKKKTKYKGGETKNNKGDLTNKQQ
jgi:hypothetical protein